MKINKRTPPDSVKNELIYRLSSDNGNREYAKKLLEKNNAPRPIILRGAVTVTLTICIAFVVIVCALIGREVLHRDRVTPGNSEGIKTDEVSETNYIFINGTLAGSAKYGEFFPHNASNSLTFAEVLANECLYDGQGNKITKLFIPITEDYRVPRDGETQSYAERLYKYAERETVDGYFVFKLPTYLSEEDSNITFTSEMCLFEAGIDSGFTNALATSKELEKYDPGKYMADVTEADKSALEGELKKLCPNGYDLSDVIRVNAADVDGDGKTERIITASSQYDTKGNPFSIMLSIDDDGKVNVVKSYVSPISGASYAGEIFVYSLYDMNLDGSPEVMVSERSVSQTVFKVYTANKEGLMYDVLSVAAY